MRSKTILTSVALATVISTASASPITDKSVIEKQSQANIMSEVIGNMTQTINNPECTVHPYFNTTATTEA